MLANEFKARLIMMDMTQTRFASELGVSVRVVNKWLNETTIPKYAILALEALENRHKPQQ
jgi:transcriptional regulator with XRE-family HTH domain